MKADSQLCAVVVCEMSLVVAVSRFIIIVYTLYTYCLLTTILALTCLHKNICVALNHCEGLCGLTVFQEIHSKASFILEHHTRFVMNLQSELLFFSAKDL